MGIERVFKGIALMSIGTIIAQLINVLSQPVITRLVPADVLGVYTYVLSLATMIIPIASLKLDMLVVSLDNDEDAQNMTDVCILVICLISFLSLSCLLIISVFYPKSVIGIYGRLIYFVPVLVFTNGIRFLFISYNNRYKEYKTITYIGLIREGARAAIQILSGVLCLDAWGQLFGYAIGPIMGLKYQTKGYLRKLKDRKFVSIGKLKYLLLSVGKKQILYIVPAQFINTVSSTFIVMSIADLFDNTALGYYSVGARILDIPIIFITANVSKVVFRHVSECIEKKQSSFKLVMKITGCLSMLSLAGFGILYNFAPMISQIAFGEGYGTAGYYIRCLCIMNGIRFVATSFAGLFTAFKKQYYELLLNLMLVLSSFCVYMIAKKLSLCITDYLWYINWGYTAVYSVMLTLYLSLSYKNDKSIM